MTMQDTINREILRYHVSHAMFCQACQTVLDVTRAVSVDILEDGDLAVTLCLCARCWDKQRDTVESKAKSKGLTVTVIDGRLK